LIPNDDHFVHASAYRGEAILRQTYVPVAAFMLSFDTAVCNCLLRMTNDTAVGNGLLRGQATRQLATVCSEDNQPFINVNSRYKPISGHTLALSP